MNKTIGIVLLIGIGSVTPLTFADYLVKNGRPTGYFAKNRTNLTLYKKNPALVYYYNPAAEKRLPYQRDPSYTSHGSDRSYPNYRDPTNRTMGNN